MTTKNIIGLALVVLGAIALGYNGFTYTRRHTVMQVGSLQATDDQRQTIPVPPALGWIMLAGGAVILVLGRRDINS
jgi:hypothetical protein